MATSNGLKWSSQSGEGSNVDKKGGTKQLVSWRADKFVILLNFL